MTDAALPQTPDWAHPRLGDYEAAMLLTRDTSVIDAVANCRGQMNYLAAPYSKVVARGDGSWNSTESLECSVRAARWARLFALEGLTVVSPLVLAVEMIHADFVDPQLEPFGSAFWHLWCRHIHKACGAVIVPPIPGWDQSDGIWRDVCAALSANRQVFLIKDDWFKRDGWRA